MSIGALVVSEAPIAAQASTVPTTKNTVPQNRTVVANSDAVAQPEPR